MEIIDKFLFCWLNQKISKNFGLSKIKYFELKWSPYSQTVLHWKNSEDLFYDVFISVTVAFQSLVNSSSWAWAAIVRKQNILLNKSQWLTCEVLVQWKTQAF